MRVVGVLLALIVLMSTNTCAQHSEIRKADSIAKLYPGHSLNDLGLLSFKLTSPLKTEVGKFRAIYKWVCSNIEADLSLVQINKRKRAKLAGEDLSRWNKKFNIRMVRILVAEQRTLCTGYAWLVRELALCAGIDCEIVNGYGKTTRTNINGKPNLNHSWNAVRLQDQWYLCDPTWGSGAVNPQPENISVILPNVIL